jgi:hypothetical protein
MPSHNHNPKYNTALQAAALTQELKPPVRFEGVTARVFPLKANMARLRAFCDAYLNMDIPKTIVHFQPALPYVYVAVLNYGKMSAEVANLGWVAQHEIAFLVPLERSREEHGKLVFQDWATVAPFIFVDDDWSLTTGREVYGWPKVRAWLTPETNRWMTTPLAEEDLLTLSTMVFPEIYEGQRQQPRVLMEIDHEPPLAITQLPPDLLSATNPLAGILPALSSSLSALGGIVEVLTGLPLLGYARDWDVQSLLAMLMKTFQSLNIWSSDLHSNNITLKQFRDAESSVQACYQAVVNSKIWVRRYNSGGLLGDANLLRGDPTGGFRIKLHQYASQPIVESLGLEVLEEQQVGNSTLTLLRPYFPFWLDLDLSYGVGETICWRAKQLPHWHPHAHTETPEPSPTAESGAGTCPYNTAQGAALQEISGPFRFPNTTIRVLPLMADEQQLKHFCEMYLENDYYRFESWGSYVYLLITNYGEMSSDTNNIGWWAEREVTFSIPVKWYAKQEGKQQELMSLALVSPFAFANSSTAAIIGREIDGRPIVHASIASPGDPWLDTSGPDAERHLLRLATEVLPALYLGQKAEERPVLEVYQADLQPSRGKEAWQAIATEWGATLLNDHRRKLHCKKSHAEELLDLKALTTELLAEEEPINEVSLKQFRDATDPNRACYQAIVLTQRCIENVYEIEEIEEPIHVRIYQYASLPIVELLGLKVKSRDITGAAEVVDLQPIRPFWMRLSIRQDLGQNLCWRIGTLHWRKAVRAPGYFSHTGSTNVGRSLVDVLDGLDSAARLPGGTQKNFKALVHGWRASTTARRTGEALLTRSAARDAVEQLTPQMAIESILSKGWLRPGATPRQRRESKPDFCVRGDSVGAFGPSVFTKGRLIQRGAWYAEDETE